MLCYDCNGRTNEFFGIDYELLLLASRIRAFLGCDVEDDVLFVVLSALAARNSSLLIRCSVRL